MSDQEILEKAIQKAIDGGWSYPFGANTYEIRKYVKARPEVIAFGLKEDWQPEDDPGHLEGHWSIPELIYNHDFAKALWGNLPEKMTFTQASNKPAPGQFLSSARKLDNWKYHLREMVIAGDQIKYLGDNI